MGDPSGFLKYKRQLPIRRPVPIRIKDWQEVYEPFETSSVEIQGARCMDCGIPFCHSGCPLGNLIPEWNDLVYESNWAEASQRLHTTNNFPDFTGRLCPAPCETACVLGINDDPVAIKQIEYEISEKAFESGWISPVIATNKTGKSVAVIGSGPAGLAAAQQLVRAGHNVTVFERADRVGGLLRYGIPEFKMQKHFLDRRLKQLEEEGVIFKVNTNVGVDLSVKDLKSQFDAIVLAGGATVARDLPLPGRNLEGIYQAMEYLPLSNKVQEGDLDACPIDAKDKKVVIIGGGDTGADCLGTAIRQGASSIHQFEIMPRPPKHRSPSTPWPLWPLLFRTSSAHEEGGERLFAVSTEEFIGQDGHLKALKAHEVKLAVVSGRLVFEKVPGSEFEIECDLIFLALGFTGAQKEGLLEQLGVEVDLRGNVSRDAKWATRVGGVFVCGDMGRGQSLVVWAIAEGRSAASAADEYLMGYSDLPRPIAPTSR